MPPPMMPSAPNAAGGNSERSDSSGLLGGVSTPWNGTAQPGVGEPEAGRAAPPLPGAVAPEPAPAPEPVATEFAAGTAAEAPAAGEMPPPMMPSPPSAVSGTSERSDASGLLGGVSEPWSGPDGPGLGDPESAMAPPLPMPAPPEPVSPAAAPGLPDAAEPDAEEPDADEPDAERPDAEGPDAKEPERHVHPPATADLLPTGSWGPGPDWAAPPGPPPDESRVRPVPPLIGPSPAAAADADEERVGVVDPAGDDGDFSGWDEGGLLVPAGRAGDDGTAAVDYALPDIPPGEHSSRGAIGPGPAGSGLLGSGLLGSGLLGSGADGPRSEAVFQSSVSGRLWQPSDGVAMSGGSDEDLDQFLSPPPSAEEEAAEAERQMLDLLRQEERAWGGTAHLPGVVE
jgi:hypothetical protein